MSGFLEVSWPLNPHFGGFWAGLCILCVVCASLWSRTSFVEKY